MTVKKATLGAQKKTKKRSTGSQKPGSFSYVMNRVKKNVPAMMGIVFLVVLLVLSFLSPYILKYDYATPNMSQRYALPSLEHLLGCDEIGRDILARILYGARYTLFIGIAATAISCVVGVVFGVLAGYFGGWVDDIIMRFLDVFQSFPAILLSLSLVAILGPGFGKVIFSVGISGAPMFARMMRANILSIRSSEYLEAAASINCSTARIMAKHVVPNAISPIIVQVAMNISGAALAASSLSFLGFGVSVTTPEWGAMLSSARQFMREYPHMVIVPGAFLMFVVLSFNLIGDAVRDALDPKLRR